MSRGIEVKASHDPRDAVVFWQRLRVRSASAVVQQDVLEAPTRRLSYYAISDLTTLP